MVRTRKPIFKRQLAPPTQELIKERLHYDPDTGVFTWKEARSSRIKDGSTAGFLIRGVPHISLEYVEYRAHRLAWCYMTGKWPRRHIKHLNGNPLDNRFENLKIITAKDIRKQFAKKPSAKVKMDE